MAKIDVKIAAQVAAKYFESIRDLIGNVKNIRLEEVEFAEDQNAWLVTLGYDAPFDPSGLSRSPLDQFLNPGNVSSSDVIAYRRDYKIFQVDSETGEVQSMKIRSVS